MSPLEIQARIGETLVQFSKDGVFPQEATIFGASIENSAFPGALEALNDTKIALEAEIRQLSSDVAPDVESWITHAQAIQDDIETSRRLANGIVRRAEADEEMLESLEEQKTYVEFLTNETMFNDELGEALRSLQETSTKLDRVQDLAGERNIMKAMTALEDAWMTISTFSPNTTVRARKILDTRCFDLRASIHEQFIIIWNSLVHIDMNERTLTINNNISDELMGLDEAIIALKAYKELDKTAKKLWEDLDDAILKPRTDLRTGILPAIQIEGNAIRADEKPADHSIQSLFSDLENIIRFLIKNLPAELIRSLSVAMMPDLSLRIKELWLDTAVPASLDDMGAYEKALVQVSDFANNLDTLEWPGIHEFHDWVANVPKIWLSKRRETSLDWIRNELSLGIGSPHPTERVEKRMVPREEGLHITATGNAVTEDWDAAWDSDEEPHKVKDKLPSMSPEGKNKQSMEEERRNSEVSSPLQTPTPEDDEDDDPSDAWGWGDDDALVETNVEQPDTSNEAPLERTSIAELREITLVEKYCTSSMPQPVLQTVIEIYNDGAKLIQPENQHLPVIAAAPGVFSLPTLILAMYRAVSPTYYGENPNGNLYLYNDAMWLSDQLRTFLAEWKLRDDIPERGFTMVRLDPEIKVLESFGKRAYTNELINQRTLLNDLLGGTQNFLQDDKRELQHGIQAVIKHIRDRATDWGTILPWSASASAIGSLVNAVASKLISDIFDLSTIGVDDAESIATILSQVEQLEDLFIKPFSDQHNGTTQETPSSMAAQFVDKWLRMSYLNQVLQSNLADIKYLWNESDLSYYFTAEEVIELIGLSFENNANVKGAIREIEGNKRPRG